MTGFFNRVVGSLLEYHYRRQYVLVKGEIESIEKRLPELGNSYDDMIEKQLICTRLPILKNEYIFLEDKILKIYKK